MFKANSVGPDLVIAGSARSGTSSLAALLGTHPAIDPGITKEPNFFSRDYNRGQAWYNGLYAARSGSSIRLDASTSYTYPQYPEALKRLSDASPAAFVVYVTREPIARAISHYMLRRYTLQLEEAPTFGAALRTGAFYQEVSDYSRWLLELRANFHEARLLLVPFEAITQSGQNVAAIICRRLSLDPPPTATEVVDAHRNNVVEFRFRGSRPLIRALRKNYFYPHLRSALGTMRIRRMRQMLIHSGQVPTVQEALDSCDHRQLDELNLLKDRAARAVREHLLDQDTRYGLNWAHHWSSV